MKKIAGVIHTFAGQRPDPVKLDLYSRKSASRNVKRAENVFSRNHFVIVRIRGKLSAIAEEARPEDASLNNPILCKGSSR